MKTILTYIFDKKAFKLEETVSIDFENPPYIPENKQLLDIDYHSFFDDEIADQIAITLENNKLLLPYKTMEVWKDGLIQINFEFFHKPIGYKIS